jgi:hypothetical protein
MHESHHTDHALTPAERELEAALRAFAPADTGADACALAFRMGESAGRSAARRWQGIAGGMAVLALAGVIGTVQGTRGGAAPIGPGGVSSPMMAERSAPSEAAAPGTPDLSGPGRSYGSSVYLRTRARALTLGASSLGVDGAVAEEGPRRAVPGKGRGERAGTWDFFMRALGAEGAL